LAEHHKTWGFMKRVIGVVGVLGMVAGLTGCKDEALEAFKAQPCGSTTLGAYLAGSASNVNWVSETVKADKGSKTDFKKVGFTADIRLADNSTESVALMAQATEPSGNSTWSFPVMSLDIALSGNNKHTLSNYQYLYFENMYCRQ
jgi:hypothetical protein